MISTNPKISVILPVFNGEKFIEESVKSILDQTFSEFELLIIDDGSTDDTLSVLRRFDDPRISVHSRRHEGLVAQLNFGLDAARSDIVARMDADDISLPERFQQQYLYLQNHNDVGVLGTAYEVIDEYGITDHIWYFPLSDRDIKNALPVLVAVSHGTVMYRREMIKNVGGYRKECFPVEDLDLWLRLFDMTAFANLDQVLLKRRTSKTSVTQTKTDEVERTLTRIAIRFIESRLNGTLTPNENFHLRIQSARTQYYHGSLQKARNELMNLMIQKPYNLQLWRYFLPSLIPERLFWILRRKGVFTMITDIFRGKNRKSKYSF